MSGQFWLTKAQLERIEPFFPRTRGIPRVDDRHVVSGIVHVIRNDLRWRDAPAVYGPHKTLYNRFVRWSRMGIFDRIFANLAAESGPPDRVMDSGFRRNDESGCLPEDNGGFRRASLPAHGSEARRPRQTS